MTEQLPVINTSYNVTTTKGQSSSLLGRGLAAIQRKETRVVPSDLNSRYRQARDIYNRITDYGNAERFKIKLLPTQNELLEDPQLLQLQPFYTMMQQLAEVFTVFQQLANQGYGKAYFPLAKMYWDGQGISDDFEKACYYYRLAFCWYFPNQTLGDSEIWDDSEMWDDLFWLICIGDYIEVELDEKEGWSLLDKAHRKAAEQGNAKAQFIVGGNYTGGVEQDYEQAVFWYRKAAEQGHAVAQDCLGERYERGQGVAQNYEQAVFWYRKAAEQGNASAQRDLGSKYEYGRGVEQDYNQAAFWYSKAAQQGHDSARRDLYLMYKKGLCVEQNDEETVLCYRESAQQGHEFAQYKLGSIYKYGLGVEQDYKQAVFWYGKAAQQGHSGAKNSLGLMYENGYGVEKDIEKAIFWYREAAFSLATGWGEEARENLARLGINFSINWQES